MPEEHPVIRTLFSFVIWTPPSGLFPEKNVSLPFQLFKKYFSYIFQNYGIWAKRFAQIARMVWLPLKIEKRPTELKILHRVEKRSRWESAHAKPASRTGKTGSLYVFFWAFNTRDRRRRTPPIFQQTGFLPENTAQKVLDITLFDLNCAFQLNNNPLLCI